MRLWQNKIPANNFEQLGQGAGPIMAKSGDHLPSSICVPKVFGFDASMHGSLCPNE